jgi:hypothetical protein
MNQLSVDPENVVWGSALRRAAPYLLQERGLRCDCNRPAALNDLVYGEITKGPSRPFAQLKYNFLERLYVQATGTKLKNERTQPGPCIGVVGNRYAPPYLIGGLSNPITGQTNGTIQGGAVVEGLFGVNVVGYVNRVADLEEQVQIKIRRVLVDRFDRSINLCRFRERLPHVEESFGPYPPLIVVGGQGTDAGKTTCAWALASALRNRGFIVTVEKKTGTACCRDWLRCCTDPRTSVLENEGDEIRLAPDGFPTRDFVDAMGVVSDASAGTRQFASASIRYTRAFLAQAKPDFHIIELADSISHISNLGLLRSRSFRRRIKALIYTSTPTHESATRLVTYLRGRGYGGVPLLLSGPLANEKTYAMARDEIRERLGLAICRSAIKENGRWIPEGSQLATAILEATSN